MALALTLGTFTNVCPAASGPLTVAISGRLLTQGSLWLINRKASTYHRPPVEASVPLANVKVIEGWVTPASTVIIPMLVHELLTPLLNAAVLEAVPTQPEYVTLTMMFGDALTL